MTDDLLQKAIDFATEKHKGQKYGNKPYITHCLAVLERVKKKTDFIPIVCSAVLHDVVEDCGISLEEIEGEFGYYVRGIVDTLTRREDEFYFEYIHRVSRNLDAVTVKLADLEENISNKPKGDLMDKYSLAVMYLRK